MAFMKLWLRWEIKDPFAGKVVCLFFFLYIGAHNRNLKIAYMMAKQGQRPKQFGSWGDSQPLRVLMNHIDYAFQLKFFHVS